MTKAHVFARSWTKLFDEPNGTADHEVVHRHVDPETGHRQVLKRASTFALMSRSVCGSCNGGWLKALEERVLPLMGAFAADRRVALDVESQADLAMWAAAASVIAASQDPVAREFIGLEFSHELYRRQQVPTGTDVWLGTNGHGEMGWFGSHSLRRTSLPTPCSAQPWGAIVSVGHSVFYVVHHGVVDQRMRLKGRANVAFRTIWTPRAPTTWPTRHRIGPRDMSPLVDEVIHSATWERRAA